MKETDNSQLLQGWKDSCSKYGLKTKLTEESISKILEGDVEESQQFIKELKYKQERDKHEGKLKLVPGMSPRIIGGVAKGASDFIKANDALNSDFASSELLVDMAVGVLRQQGVPIPDSVKKTAKNVINATFKQRGSNETVSGFGSSNTPEPKGGVVVMNPPVVNLKFDTHLDNSLYEPLLVRPTVDVTSDKGTPTAFMSGVRWTLPPQNDYMDEAFDTWVSNFQIKAQALQGFNIQATKLFTVQKLKTVFQYYMNALSVYYFYANTYAYTMMNENTGSRTELREMFNTDDLQYIQLLEERLNGLPIPPRLNERAAFLFSIYHTSRGSRTSNTISFTPLQLIDDGNQGFIGLSPTNGIKEQLNYLKDSDFVEVTAMLARVFPNWKNTRVGASQTPDCYSDDFNNIWYNSPGSTDVNGSLNFPYSDLINDEVRYVQFNDFTRSNHGDQQATFSIYDTQRNTWSGFLEPYVSSYGVEGEPKITNRYAFVSTTNLGRRWVPADCAVGGRTPLLHRQPWTNYYVLGGWNIHIPNGSYELLGNSIESNGIIQAKHLNYMLGEGLSSTSNESKPPKRKFRGKPKTTKE